MFVFALVMAVAEKVPPVPLAPTGPWYVRAEENMCLLEHRYTSGSDTISLVFQPLLDLPQMNVFVIAPNQGGAQFDGDFAATAGDQPFKGRYLSAVLPKTKTRVTRLSAERRMLDEMTDGQTLRVRAKPVDKTFTLVKPEKARVALRTCVDGLKRAWGIDPDLTARTASALEGNPARFFGPDAYPREAIAEGIYGRVVAFLNVDASGSVTNCRIVASAGKALNDGTCKAAARIRFKPARDKDGNGLPSTYLLPVRWVMPGSPDF